MEFSEVRSNKLAGTGRVLVVSSYDRPNRRAHLAPLSRRAFIAYLISVSKQKQAEVRTYRIPISQMYHPEYKTNLMRLKRFVMVRFLNDTTVIPNISSVRHLSPANKQQAYAIVVIL